MGGLSSAHEILVLLTLKGGNAYAAKMERAAATNNAFAASLLRTSANMSVASKRTWVHNQALFTARRYAFYTTLAFTALAYSVAKLGFSYLSTIQTARVALQNFFPTDAALQSVIDRLYTIAALSPLLFKDVLTAFRTMYPAFKGVGISADLTIRTIQAITDALATAGRTSPGQINRIGVQLQHMAAIGRPTGQVILALGRNGIQVYEALRKELGLTGDEVRNIGQSSITTKQVMEALWRFYEGKGSRFKGAAERLANRSLLGAWQNFIDVLSQAAGIGEAGLFGGLTHLLAGVNAQLNPLLRANKPITLTNIAQAIDSQLTPGTHLLLRLFMLTRDVLKVIIFEFQWWIRIISMILKPFDKLLDAFGLGNWALKIYAFWLGTTITLWLIGRWAAMMLILRMLFMESITWGLATAWSTYVGIVTLATTVTDALTGAFWALTVAMLTTPVGWILLALSIGAAMTILYFKWKRFHDAVNATWDWLKRNPLVSAFTPLLNTIIGIVRWMTRMYRIAVKIIDLVKHPLGGAKRAGGGFKNWATNWRNWANIMSPVPIPFMQHGGRVIRSGLAVVGERGPELLRLPAASVIQPLSLADGLAGSFALYVYPQDIYLDGKKVATVTATAVTDKEARMHGRRG